MTPSPLDISSSVTASPHVHTSRIACKSRAFRFRPTRVAGPSTTNSWSSVGSIMCDEDAAISGVGGSCSGGLGEAGSGSAGWV
jgi:hypothetical protein